MKRGTWNIRLLYILAFFILGAAAKAQNENPYFKIAIRDSSVSAGMHFHEINLQSKYEILARVDLDANGKPEQLFYSNRNGHGIIGWSTNAGVTGVTLLDQKLIQKKNDERAWFYIGNFTGDETPEFMVFFRRSDSTFLQTWYLDPETGDLIQQHYSLDKGSTGHPNILDLDKALLLIPIGNTGASEKLPFTWKE